MVQKIINSPNLSIGAGSTGLQLDIALRDIPNRFCQLDAIKSWLPTSRYDVLRHHRHPLRNHQCIQECVKNEVDRTDEGKVSLWPKSGEMSPILTRPTKPNAEVKSIIDTSGMPNLGAADDFHQLYLLDNNTHPKLTLRTFIE